MLELHHFITIFMFFFFLKLAFYVFFDPFEYTKIKSFLILIRFRFESRFNFISEKETTIILEGQEKKVKEPLSMNFSINNIYPCV